MLGHSMGGMVAQEVIARRPDKVKKLILCGTSAAFGKRTDGRSAEAWAQQFIGQRTAPLDAGKTMADMAATLVPQMVGPGALPEGSRELQCAHANLQNIRRAIGGKPSGRSGITLWPRPGFGARSSP